MAHFLEVALPALVCSAGIDLCFLGGEYTCWIFSAAVSIVP